MKKYYIFNQNWGSGFKNIFTISLSVVLLVVILITWYSSWDYYIFLLLIIPIFLIYLWTIKSYVELYESYMIISVQRLFRKSRNELVIYYKDIDKIGISRARNRRDNDIRCDRIDIYYHKQQKLYYSPQNGYIFFIFPMRYRNSFSNELMSHWVNVSRDFWTSLNVKI